MSPLFKYHILNNINLCAYIKSVLKSKSKIFHTMFGSIIVAYINIVSTPKKTVIFINKNPILTSILQVLHKTAFVIS